MYSQFSVDINITKPSITDRVMVLTHHHLVDTQIIGRIAGGDKPFQFYDCWHSLYFLNVTDPPEQLDTSWEKLQMDAT